MKYEIQRTKLQEIITNYKSKQPFQAYLKDYFAKNKNMGSSDRRFYANAAYAYMRLHKGLPNDLPIDQKIIACCAHTPNFADQAFIYYHLNKNENSTPPPLDFSKIFVADDLLSNKLNKPAFLKGYLHTPKIWLRVRPTHYAQVTQSLEKAQITFVPDAEMPDAISVTKGNITDLDVFKYGLLQVQDRSSQCTTQLMHPKPNQHWWDCCAASGGKTILLHDLEPSLKLYVTDVRTSILDNLKERFKQHRIKTYQQATADLTKFAPLQTMASFPKNFDGIVLDAPCSGSGTWGRTPEQLLHFDPSQLQTYTQKQLEIAQNVIPYLKVGGTLIYITCSVYACENEEIITKILHQNPDLRLNTMKYFEGADYQADTLFGAVLQRIA
jgi:16S rRNA (cytosine967-C5)-methyltransferase